MKTPAKIALTLSLMIPFIAGGTPSLAAERVSTLSPNSSTQSEFSQAQLDAMLAPIALYPDTVLSHVLIASTYPLEIVEADRWARNHPNLKGDDAVEAVDNQDWDPSVKALVAFPDILQRMSEDLDWTQRLGDAFLADEQRVMDSIQTLRNRAYDSGNLDKVDHVRVVREEKIIVIEPSVERVVYVPAYDTRVVYGNWWWPDYPPVYWHYPSSYVFVSGFYWGPRIYLGPRFYFSACHWHDRRVVVVDHHHHNHPRFYDSRSIVRYEGARHWNHDPVHRRGVAYYDDRIRTRYNSPRESYRDSHEYRDRVRNPHIAPNEARERRQHDSHTAGGMHNTLRDNEHNRTRADELRARMNEHSQGNNTSGERATNRTDRIKDSNRSERMDSRPSDNRSVERSTGGYSERIRGNNQRTEESRPTYRGTPSAEPKQENRLYGADRFNRSEPPRVERNEPRVKRSESQRIERTAPRIEHTESQRIERTAPRLEHTESQRIERTAPRIERSESQRVETAPRIERTESPRVERAAPRFERSESQRVDRSESFNRSRDENRGSTRESNGGRTVERGGRER